MYKRLSAVLLMMLLLTGCNSDQRILEKLGMMQTASYDLAENDQLKATLSVPVIDPESSEHRHLLTAVTDSLKEARVQLSNQIDLLLVSGQLRSVLFGLSLAKEGLADHVDTLIRDPSIALGVQVTVVDGDAGKLLSKTFKPNKDTGTYVNHLLKKESSSNIIPPTTLYEFTREYYDDGIDPIAPIVKDGGDRAGISGIALFQDDRFVTKIPAKDGIIFALLRGNINQGELSVNLGERNGRKEMVMLSSMLNKRKVSVQHLGDNRFKFIIANSIHGSVLEYTGHEDLSQSKDRHKLEADIAEYISDKAQEVVRQLQQNNVDSIGIGQYVRNSLSYKAWKSLNWRKVYPGVEVECRVKVTIKDYGKYM
ncbi:Ger(x)C family spore germination protein [Paenibacillus riograndensis]|uniref:Ger(X)C family germination protein n=1 Tax=Paenibacillus riograndensis SBR5 TaxID=1073571 RepID=A0A0E4CYW8_9BACL|nr:Ger(x)C family spore germination protein [Paenibacillus riograndensis]CQR57942.1 Ger(x)C family germination protein [Paenibacillus riograndensis SBR5]